MLEVIILDKKFDQVVNDVVFSLEMGSCEIFFIIKNLFFPYLYHKFLFTNEIFKIIFQKIPLVQLIISFLFFIVQF